MNYCAQPDCIVTETNGGAYIYVSTLETTTLTAYEHLPMKTSPSPEHKFITEPQYLELCKACDQILRAQDSTAERVAMSWLHVIRERPPRALKRVAGRTSFHLCCDIYPRPSTAPTFLPPHRAADVLICLPEVILSFWKKVL